MLEDTVSRDYVSRPAVAEMEKLYNEILSKLQSRVEVLEAGGRKPKGAPAARRTKRTGGATSSSTTYDAPTNDSFVGRPTAMSAVRSTGRREQESVIARGASHAVRARRRAAAAHRTPLQQGSCDGCPDWDSVSVYGLKSRFRV